MGKNHKTIIMQRNKTGIKRAVYDRPTFGTAYALLHQFLSFTTLSRKNILWAAKCVQDIRSNPAMGIEDITIQEKLIQLDRAVTEAKARLQRREERRERIKSKEEAELGLLAKPKKGEPLSPQPATDLMKLWQSGIDKFETEKKEKQDREQPQPQLQP